MADEGSERPLGGPRGGRRDPPARTGRHLADALQRAVADLEDEDDAPVGVPALGGAAAPGPVDPDDAPLDPSLEGVAYRIGEVAQLVGVDAHVLRYWESEFRMRPERSTSGQRLYRREELARFLRIKTLLHDEGYTIAGARRALERGGAPAAALDPGRLRAALDQITSLRRMIRALQDDLEESG